MEKSHTPQSQDNAAKDANQSRNKGTSSKGVTASPIGTPIKNRLGDPDNSNNLSKTKAWLTKYATPTLVIELLVFCVGIYVAFIYSGQLGQMIESNKISRESLTSVQRAFMTYEGTQYRQFANKTVDGNNWVFEERFVNNGTTPAIQVMQRFWADELPNGLGEQKFIGEDAPEVKTISGTVGPKEPHSIGPRFKSDFFVFGNAPTLPDLKHPEKNRPNLSTRNISFWGWIIYRDIFPETPMHLTEFCQNLQGVVFNPGTGVQLMFSNCKAHNCTDKYCDDYQEIMDAVFPK